MNWLGELVSKEVSIDDVVLDLGCGIMQAIEGLQCKSILGCDVWRPYLDKIKNTPTICLNMNELDRFVDSSYDVVLCLDVLEHLDKETALKSIDEMKRICRKKVIIYTPNEFKTNDESIKNSWGLGYNEHQKHLCLLNTETLQSLGFTVRTKNVDRGNFGVYIKWA